MEKDFDRMCRGALPLHNLPSVCPRSVTFFIISSFSDFEKEREVLRNIAYPRLYEYFRLTYGLEFQCIDLKLGLEHVDYDESDYWDLFHNLTEKYAIASYNCVPVILLGQKLGLPLLPKRLATRVFQLIRSTLRAHQNADTANYALLDDWYQLDSNANRDDCDSEHVLIPAKNVFPNMTSKNSQLRAAALQKWKETAKLLANLFKIGLGLCLQDPATLDDKSVFDLLVFELSTGVSHVLGNSDLSRYRPIVFSREIVDLTNYLNEERAEAFIDTMKDKETGESVVDDSVNQMLQALHQKVNNYVGIDRKFSVLWRFPGGIEKDLHQNYLGEFSEAFMDAAKSAVDMRMAENNVFSENGLSEIFDPIWTSLHLCNTLAPFCLEEGHITQGIVDYCTRVDSQNNAPPLVLVGPHDSGKMPIVAHAFYQTQGNIHQLLSQDDGQYPEKSEWLESVVLVIRMVQFKQRMSDLIAGIFAQLNACLPLEVKQVPESFFDLIECIRSHPVVLLIGGCERIVDEFGERPALRDIMPTQLPSNVRFVFTSVPEDEFTEGVCFTISQMSINKSREFIDAFLEREQRSLTESQSQRVDAALPSVHNMFHVSLLCENLVKACSFDFLDTLPSSSEEFLDGIFNRLELCYGSVLVQHVFCLISLSSSGLSDTEIIDILSLDDMILDELLVPIEDGIRRFPQSVWQLLKHNMKLLIDSICSDGYFLVYWANEEVAEAVKQRYLSNEELTKSMHYIIADYFLGTWHSVSKPISTAALSAEDVTANRLMPSQNLVYATGDHKFFNYRALRQLPRHLLLSDRITELYNIVLFNYDWLYYKSASLGLAATMEDFALMPQDVEVALVEETMRKAESTLRINLNNLASEISGNLVTYSYLYRNIKNLVRQADIYGCNHNIFVPAYSYPKLPGSALQSTVECPSQLQSMELHDGVLYVKLVGDANLYRYSLESNKMLPETRMSCGEMYLSSDQKYAVIVDEAKRNCLRVHRVDDGSYVGHVLPLNWIDAIPFEEKNMFRISKIKVGREMLSCVISSRASYVIVANICTCQPVHVFKPEHRATLCDLTPDERFILTNNGEQVLIFEVGNGVQTSAVDLLAFPKKLTFTKDGSKAFILCEGEQKVVILFMDSKGGIEMSYKIMFDSTLSEDRLQDMKISQNEQLLLVRAEKNVIVYEFQRDAIVCHIRRPAEIPAEFKMPNANYESINFSDANFAFDDRVIITSIFRDVLIWEVADGKPLVMLHAPTGILSRLIVDQEQNMLIGYIAHSKEIHLWSLQGAFTDGTVIDSLTAEVKSISTCKSQAKAVACCSNSDEMGVLDLNTGFLTDLYSHEGIVLSCAISSCGNFAIATVKQRSPGTTNIVWSLLDRKIVTEFGNVPGYLLPCQTGSDIYVVHQSKIAYRQPYNITRVTIDDQGSAQVVQCDYQLPFLIGSPFLTANENWLVALAPTDLDDSNAEYIEPKIIAWSLSSGSTNTIGPNMLSSFDLVRRIVDVRPCVGDSDILIMYSSDDSSGKTPSSESECPGIGIMVIDLNDLTLKQLASNILMPTIITNNVKVSGEACYCIDIECNALYSIEAGAFLQQVAPESFQFHCFAARDSLMIFTRESSLYAYRLPECTLAGQLDVHCDIHNVQVHNDNFILIGTKGGNVLNFRIVDSINEKDIIEAVQAIPSRDGLDSERTRSWDRLVKSSLSSGKSANRHVIDKKIITKSRSAVEV